MSLTLPCIFNKRFENVWKVCTLSIFERFVHFQTHLKRAPNFKHIFKRTQIPLIILIRLRSMFDNFVRFNLFSKDMFKDPLKDLQGLKSTFENSRGF